MQKQRREAELFGRIRIEHMSSQQISQFIGYLEDTLQVGRWSNHQRNVHVIVRGYAVDVFTEEVYDFTEVGRVVQVTGSTDELVVCLEEGDIQTVKRVVPGSNDATWDMAIFRVLARGEEKYDDGLDS